MLETLAVVQNLSPLSPRSYVRTPSGHPIRYLRRAMKTHFVRTGAVVVQFDADPPFRPGQMMLLGTLYDDGRTIDAALTASADEGQTVTNVIVVPVTPPPTLWQRLRHGIAWGFSGKRWP